MPFVKPRARADAQEGFLGHAAGPGEAHAPDTSAGPHAFRVWIQAGLATKRTVQSLRNAQATRRVFVALPPEDRLPGEEDMCALLLKSLYGTRDAAFNWTQAYTDALTKLGLSKGESSPCSFWHNDKQIATIVMETISVQKGRPKAYGG